MIWPWSRIAELEGALQLQARELNDSRQRSLQVDLEIGSERARRIGAEALAAERKEEALRLREDLAASRQAEREARELLAKSLVEANVRLTSPMQDKPPDMDKIRAMVPQDMNRLASSAGRRHRQMDEQVMMAVLTKLRPDLGARLGVKPVVAQENPPGEGERPSLNAVG